MAVERLASKDDSDDGCRSRAVRVGVMASVPTALLQMRSELLCHLCSTANLQTRFGSDFCAIAKQA